MKKEEFYYDSRDGRNKIRAMYWIPDKEIKGILQIVHGMAEHIGRYDDFAEYIAGQGILVAANDHLGHGKSVETADDKGYFCENDPVTVTVRDVHRLKKMTQEKYPGKPYVILGHSFGSFVARNYIFRYGKGIDGAIISGTGYQPAIKVNAGKALMRMIALIKGWRYRSKFADSLVNGGANDKIENPRTPFDWLSRDPEVVDKYIADDDSGFLFTLNGLYTVVDSLSASCNVKEIAKMRKDLPVMFISGDMDPVGNYSEGVKWVYDRFIEAGMQKTSLKLYPGARHEVLNETNKNEVYEDVYKFCLSVFGNDGVEE